MGGWERAAIYCWGFTSVPVSRHLRLMELLQEPDIGRLAGCGGGISVSKEVDIALPVQRKNSRSVKIAFICSWPLRDEVAIRIELL